jgi:hypothetical protein
MYPPESFRLMRSSCSQICTTPFFMADISYAGLLVYWFTLFSDSQWKWTSCLKAPSGLLHKSEFSANGLICLLHASCLTYIRPWRWRRHFPPKRQSTFNGLHGVIPQKTELSITSAVRASKPAWFDCSPFIKARSKMPQQALLDFLLLKKKHPGILTW